MTAHVDAITALQAAVVDGRLADARLHAEWLAEHEMAAPAQWRPYIDKMRDAAVRIAHASDVASAGAGLGELGHACASCHLAFDARLAFSYRTAPGDEHTLADQMLRHRWAAARLWEGVFGPSDAQWNAGARVTSNLQLDLAATVHEAPNADVFAFGEQLREQGDRARTITAAGDRARFYGELMATCAGCHAIVRPSPVAASRTEP